MSNVIDRYAEEWAAAALPHTAPMAKKDSWRANVVSASSITPKAIHWAWPGWLALGKLTILAGAGGTGKTTLAIGLIATLTSGGRWPDGERCKDRRSAIIWSSEDDPADTIIPRLIAVGADLRKVHILQGRINGAGETEAFDPAKDMDLMAQAFEQIGDVGLLMIDPIVSAVAGDMHRANDVRRSLQGLVDLAEQYDCAVIGITHFSKGSQGNNPAERVLGSQAFGALARTVLVAAKQEDSELRVLARAKSNIAIDDGGCSYTIEECTLDSGITTTRVMWGDKIEGTAREILADVERVDNGETSEKEDAEHFLISLLADGPVPTKQIKADAAGAGHAWRTVERAKKTLGIEARKAGLNKGWVWQLGAEDRQQNPKTAREKSDGLREKVAVFEKERRSSEHTEPSSGISDEEVF